MINYSVDRSYDKSSHVQLFADTHAICQSCWVNAFKKFCASLLYCYAGYIKALYKLSCIYIVMLC